MHPIIEEICRAGASVRPDVLRRWQRQLRDELQPMLDEREALLAEKAATKESKRGKAVTA